MGRHEVVSLGEMFVVVFMLCNFNTNQGVFGVLNKESERINVWYVKLLK